MGDNNEEDNFIPAQYRDNLRKLVKKELELVNNSNENLDLKNVTEIIKEDIETELKNQDLKNDVEESNSVVEESNSVVEESKPAVEESKPAVEESNSVVEESNSVVEE